MNFTPGNWDIAEQLREKHPSLTAPADAIFRPIVSKLPGADWDAIADKVNNNQNAGLDIVQGGLNVIAKGVPPLQAALLAGGNDKIDKFKNFIQK